MRIAACSTLIALAVLPAIFAAPVPPDAGPPAFGSTGLLTSDDLGRVKFDSQMTEEISDVEVMRLPRGRQPNSYDVAVHIPQNRVREGDSIPAYFVVKNCLTPPVGSRRDQTLGLDMRLDFSGPVPSVVGSCSLELRDRGTNKPVNGLVQRITHCGGGSLADIPYRGYYVAKGDLNRTGAVPLPPGDYEVDFTYLQRRSAPVRFTVAANPNPVSHARPVRKPFRFVTIEPDDDEAPGEAEGDCFLWKECSLNGVEAERMAAALAVGVGGKFVPDIRTIPAADGRVEARVSLRNTADGDRLIVTLVSADPKKEVGFKTVPRLYLQIEDEGDEGRVRRDRADKKLMEMSDRPHFRTPLTIEVPLQKNWRKELGLENACRLAVVVTSKELKFPSGGDKMDRVQDSVEHRAVRLGRDNSDEPPVWSGVVRTAFANLDAVK